MVFIYAPLQAEFPSYIDEPLLDRIAYVKLVPIDLWRLRGSPSIVVGRPNQDAFVLRKRTIIILPLRCHIYDVDIRVNQMENRRNRRVILDLALSNEYQDAVYVIEDELVFAVLVYQVVAPRGSVENLKVAARIRITTAYIVGIVLDFAPKNGLTRSTLYDVKHEEKLEVDVKVVVDLEVLDL